jgi:hypothetical protein
MDMEELELLSYFKKPILTDCFGEVGCCDLSFEEIIT